MPKPLGLRTRLMLWSSVVLAAWLLAGVGWVHYGLRQVLHARNDALLQRKSAELLADVGDQRPGGTAELEAEVRREVRAYEPEGLMIVVHQPDRALVAPDTNEARELATRVVSPRAPVTLMLGNPARQYRVLASSAWEGRLTLVLGIALEETRATLAAFDRLVAGGALVLLVLAAVGGRFLSGRALQPVAMSIGAARRLDPENLSARLPLTGAGDELDELAATINGLLERLAAYHVQVIRLTADVSHELRSPLAAMRAAVEVALQRPRAPDEYRNTLIMLGEQSERLTALVNSLLLLARADAGEIAIRRDPVDLATLARDVADLFDPLADERGVALMADTAEAVLVAGDAARLRQLVINLVDNAVRFADPGGSVKLRVARAGGNAVLCVANTGTGISPEHLPRLFDRFYQVDPSRSSDGCGLGLSICRWIIQAHGGTVEVRSDAAEGTEFTVTLPRNPVVPATAPIVHDHAS